MASQLRIIDNTAPLKDATLLLALTGWMDGGDVSTGSVRQLMHGRKRLRELARIEADDFYIYNFPGSMEIAALFRPPVKYDDGIVKRLEMPTNVFVADDDANLVFFVGREPNLKWQRFSDCIFTLAKSMGVTRIIFIGSFGGSVPHTRAPRLFGSVSHPHLRETLTSYGVRLSEYEGPASFSSLLLYQAKREKIEMLSFVAEIPGYLQGTNPLSIEAISKRVARMLNVPIDLATLREQSNEWEARVSTAVSEDEELAATVKKLEEEYDNELIAEGQ